MKLQAVLDAQDIKQAIVEYVGNNTEWKASVDDVEILIPSEDGSDLNLTEVIEEVIVKPQ